MRTSRQWIIGGAILVSSLAIAVGKSQTLSFSVNSYGIQTLTYNNFTFVNAEAHDVLWSLTVPALTNTGVVPTAVVSRKLDGDSLGTMLTYAWGSIHLRYQGNTNKLSIAVTVSNTSTGVVSDVALDLMEILVPSAPPQYDGSVPLLKTSSDAPVVFLSYSNGTLAVVNEDLTQPLTIGFPVALDRPTNTVFQLMVDAGSDSRYNPMYYGAMPPIPPNGSVTYRVSIRFGGGTASPVDLAGDIFGQFAAEYPLRLTWPDRQPLGMDGLSAGTASSPTNPRGWFNNPNADYISVAGRAQFRLDLLARADQEIALLKYLNAQGIIIWDIEGTELSISYVGDPRQLGMLAPEMDTVADEFLKKYSDAGLRIGLTIRPQIFAAGTNFPANCSDGQVFIKTDAPLHQKEYVCSAGTWVQKATQQQQVTDYGASLSDKIRYAKSRWGATVFYLDSYLATSPYNVAPLTNIYSTFPDILMLPEHRSTGYFSVTAPFLTPQYDGYLTPDYGLQVYPRAFSVIRVYSPWDSPDQLMESVQQGNILLLDTYYSNATTRIVWQAYNQLSKPIPPSNFQVLTNGR